MYGNSETIKIQKQQFLKIKCAITIAALFKVDANFNRLVTK